MTSQPPTPPSTNEVSATTANDQNDLGPVTKLAAIAAAQAEADRIEQRKAVQASLQAHASLVGETAMAIAAATQSSPSLKGSSRSNAITTSPIRLSPKQKESLKGPLPGVGGSSPGRRSMNQLQQQQQQKKQQLPPKMSVAARARAAADLPTTQPRQDLIRRSSNNNKQSSSSSKQQPQYRQTQSRPELGSHAPPSGNAGISRGKFSKEQVKQMIDEWGREESTDNSDEEDDEEYYSDDYYQEGSGVGNTDRLGEEQQQQQYKETKAYSHLQYTMSSSPGPKDQNSSGRMSEEEEEEEEVYHYQHHKVSNYSNYNQQSSSSPSPPHDHHHHDNGGGGGIFASAKNWLQSQRERLHQLELERQVEDQRRKLVEEGRKQRAAEAERRRRLHQQQQTGHDTVGNNEHQHGARASHPQPPAEIPSSGSFGCMSGEVGIVGIIGPSSEDTTQPPTNHQQQQLQNHQSEQDAIVSSLCGFGGMYSNTNQLLDESITEDYSGVARIDSQGNILEMIPSGSFEDEMNGGYSLENGGEGGHNQHSKHMKVAMKVSSPKCTLSGQGMSVNVDLPDVDLPLSSPEKKQDHYPNSKQQQHDDDDVHEENDYEEEDEDADATTTTSDEDDPYFNTTIKIVPEPPQDEITGSAPILQLSQMKALISSGGLPPSLNFCKWKRLYNLTRDGDSFETFLRMVEGHERTVMVVKTTREQLFGGYADTRWEAKHVRQHAFEFYGSAQACLFRFPNYGSGKNKKNGRRGREDKTIIYKWSGANRYIQLCDAARRTVAFGGGGNEGEFGLCIEDDFRRGTTGHCSTFENEALCEEGYFDVMDLEVWGFTLDF